MLTKLISAIGCALVLSVASNAMAADPMLADRHVARGVACASCHKTAPTAGAVVKKDTCKACHSPEGLAERTAKVEPNPHFNHLGDVSCTDCHKGHQAPQVMCNDCHKFNLKTK